MPRADRVLSAIALAHQDSMRRIGTKKEYARAGKQWRTQEEELERTLVA
jgi:hypothetical protein